MIFTENENVRRDLSTDEQWALVVKDMGPLGDELVGLMAGRKFTARDLYRSLDGTDSGMMPRECWALDQEYSNNRPPRGSRGHVDWKSGPFVWVNTQPPLGQW